MKKSRYNRIIAFVFFGILLVLLIISHTRGFIAHDEGLMVNPAFRMINGEIPYKDFQFYYFPGALIVYSAILSVWESLFALRLGAVVFSLIGAVLVYKITYNIAKTRSLSYLLTILFLLFGSFTINFLSPTMLAIPPALAGLYFLTQKPQTRRTIFSAGIAAGLTLFFKQNFALAIFITTFAVIFLGDKKQRVNFSKNFLLGVLAIWLPVIFYLTAIGAFGFFLDGIIYFVYEKTIKMGLQVTPFIQPDTIPRQILKTIFYTLPAIVSIVAIFLSFIHKKEYLPYGIFSLFFYIFGIRPTTDYIHLAPLFAIMVIPFAAIYSITKSSFIKTLVIITIMLLILLGTFTVITKHYYRWDRPLPKHNMFFNEPKINLFLHADAIGSVTEFKKITTENKTTNNYMFLYDFMPMYYFLTDTRNPTRFDFIPPLSIAEETEIIEDLRSSQTQIIVTYSDLAGDNSEIGKFIKKNFDLKKYPRFFVWILKN